MKVIDPPMLGDPTLACGVARPPRVEPATISAITGPPTTVAQPGPRSRLEWLTRHIERTYGDGTKFFDQMDHSLRTSFWYDVQYVRFRAEENLSGMNIIPVVSGEWGKGMAKHLGWNETLILPGNLRHEELDPITEDLSGLDFIFLDDSCYLGRTRNKIRDRIEQAGGFLLYTLVLYDGSHQPIEGIEGIYRYHEVTK